MADEKEKTQDAKGSEESGPKGSGVFEIDGKAYKPEDVKGLLAQVKSMTEKGRQAQIILDTAGKYGLDPESYVVQAEAALGVVGDLINKGVINDHGELVSSKEKEKGRDESSEGGDLERFLKLTGKGEGDTKGLGGVDRIAAVVAKAIGIDQINQRIERFERTQNQMLRLDVENKLQAKFPNFSSEDVDRVLFAARMDPKKTIWQHAEERAEMKKAERARLREEVAKEFGIDPKQFDENKLKEQDAKGGASGMFKGKKFSFRSGDKEAVNPMRATMEFFRKQHREGS